MKLGLYRKLAWQGIRKNKRMYTPYLLTCSGMVMMFYIIHALSRSPAVATMKGGGTLEPLLQFGAGVMGIFSLIFLFYTNSFLIRRRKKEFGLYNILGMGKGHLGWILLFDTVFAGAIALGGGLLGGIALYKLFELGIVNLLHGEITYSLTISGASLWETGKVFGGIFLLIFLSSFWKIRLSNPVALLRGEQAGEKPPKANWFLGLLGAGILGFAYYLASAIQDPVSAVGWFFIAVVLVILGTYLLLISGSVVLCRILQKRKKYYYKANHFVSVSSMAFRMKRNGAGLASICILVTMVLVMLSSTSSLYFGQEDSLRTRFPREITLDARFQTPAGLEEANVHSLETTFTDAIAQEGGLKMENCLSYRYASLMAYRSGSRMEGTTDYAAFSTGKLENLWNILLVPLSDYNRSMGTAYTLDPGEALIYTNRDGYGERTLSLGSQCFRLVGILPEFMGSADMAMDLVPSMALVVPDLDKTVAELPQLTVDAGEALLSFRWFFGFDAPNAGDDLLSDASMAALDRLGALEISESSDLAYVMLDNLREYRADFYSLYGSLFFLGIMLSLVFVLAAVLILYYKQVSEGYEDQARFEIMQKVGMTKRDIRKSINSQMLTVFFLPLLLAGVHLIFAFPIIRKLLILFNLTNLALFATATAISFVVFALFYVLVYKITAGVYFTIVSGRHRQG